MRHWYTRYEISNAIDRGDLAAVLARGHAARCPACQGFAARLQAQHAQLTLGASAARAPGVAARRPRAVLLLAPLALGGAALLAITLRASPAPVVPTVAVIPVAAPSPLAARVSALFETASEPLDDELRNLWRDGRRGVQVVLATGGLRGLAE